MKKRALAALLLCLCFLMLSGCWQEDLSEPESLTPMQSFEEEAEAEEEHAIIPEVFSLPYAPGQTLDPTPVRTVCSKPSVPCFTRECSA